MQLAHISSQLQLSDQRVQELEAAKDQLEHDLFSTQNSLEQLQSNHERVSGAGKVRAITLDLQFELG